MPAYPELSALKPRPRQHVPAILALAVFCICLLITAILWNNAKQASRSSLQVEFDYRVREVVGDISVHMNAYRQVLLGVKGLMHGSIDIDRSRFRDYIETLRLPKIYPGIQGIAISEIIPPTELDKHVASVRNAGFPDYGVRPPGEREIYTAITTIEPFTPMNQRAFGYDMFSEAVRRDAMERARDRGAAALSGKVVLVQEGSTDVQSGFLMYLPVYRRNMPIDTVAQRREHILGWVYAPFRVDDFVRGLGGERAGQLDVVIYDGANRSDAACLFGCAGAKAASPVFRDTRQLEIAGRIWTLDVRSTTAFEQQLDDSKPVLIAGAGGGISLLLALLVWLLATGRNRALALAMDMTRELRTSEFRWKFALEGGGEGIWDWDLTTGKIMYSRRWKEMLGYADSDLSDDVAAWEALIHPEDRDRMLAVLRDYMDGKATVYLAEHRLRCKEGGWKWIQARGMAVARDGQGRPLRIIGTHKDITEQKESERREQERQRALEETQAALQQSQRLEAVGKLTGGVAHDFNNVLQIISGNIQLLKYAGGDETQCEQRLTSMQNAVERGAKLSSQLLAFARRQPLQPRVTHAGNLLHNMDDMIRRAVGESIDVHTRIDDDLWNTFVDPVQLENVILNLVFNARDAMNGAGSLTLEAHNASQADKDAHAGHDLPAGQYVALSVTDTGVGIPDEIMEHIFEPFFTTKPEGKGTGLGLSMAYGFVKQSGGHIRIDSEPGQGTTVCIYLPCSPEHPEQTRSRQDAPVAGGKETILVVEDDASVQAAVVSMLQNLGYQVLKADNADQALAIIEDGAKIDLLFTDVVMPGKLRSPELASQARAILPDLTVLFTSGYTRDAIMHGGRLDPGVQLLSKPYRQEQLARKVREVLGES